MEPYVAVGVGVVACLVVAIAWLWRRGAREIRRSREIEKKLRHDLDLVLAELHQTKFLDLDVSSIENSVEENKQQLEALIHVEVDSIRGELDDVDKRLTTIEDERFRDQDDQISALEEDLRALETRLLSLENKSASN